MRGVSINIGSNINFNNGRGYYDPIDGSFCYLPIEEKYPTKDTPKFKEIIKTKKQNLIHPDLYAHYDPEFKTFTYGHVIRGFGDVKALKRLKKGDYLFFHATLENFYKKGQWMSAPQS